MHHIFASTSLEQSRWRSLGEPRCGEMGGSGWHGRLGCDLANSQPAKPALLLLFMLARSWAVDVSALFTCVMRAMVAPAMAANMCTPLVYFCVGLSCNCADRMRCRKVAALTGASRVPASRPSPTSVPPCLPPIAVLSLPPVGLPSCQHRTSRISHLYVKSSSGPYVAPLRIMLAVGDPKL